MLKYCILLCLNGIFSWSFDFINFVGKSGKRKKIAQNQLKRRKEEFWARFEDWAHFGTLGHAFKIVAHDHEALAYALMLMYACICVCVVF